jgi:hypothetical protein
LIHCKKGDTATRSGLGSAEVGEVFTFEAASTDAGAMEGISFGGVSEAGAEAVEAVATVTFFPIGLSWSGS